MARSNLTASARTLKRSYSEPQFVLAATVLPSPGKRQAFIIIPPAVLKNLESAWI